MRIALFSPLSLSHTLMSSEDLSPHKSNFLLLMLTPAATHRTTSCSATLQAGAPTREAECTLPLQLFWRMDDLEAQMSPNWVKIQKIHKFWPQAAQGIKAAAGAAPPLSRSRCSSTAKCCCCPSQTGSRQVNSKNSQTFRKRYFDICALVLSEGHYVLITTVNICFNCEKEKDKIHTIYTFSFDLIFVY